jgi:hypothetical protein
VSERCCPRAAGARFTARSNGSLEESVSFRGRCWPEEPAFSLRWKPPTLSRGSGAFKRRDTHSHAKRGFSPGLFRRWELQFILSLEGLPHNWPTTPSVNPKVATRLFPALRMAGGAGGCASSNSGRGQLRQARCPICDRVRSVCAVRHEKLLQLAKLTVHTEIVGEALLFSRGWCPAAGLCGVRVERSRRSRASRRRPVSRALGSRRR